MTNAQKIAKMLNDSNTGTIAFIKTDRNGDHYVEAMVPGLLNGQPALFPEVIRTERAARRLIDDMQ